MGDFMIGLGWRCLFKKNDSVLWMPFSRDPNYVSCIIMIDS